MAYSQVTYTGDGTTTTFSIPFDYIEQGNVEALVNGVAVVPTFPSQTTLNITPAPLDGALVLIRRVTPIDNKQVDFTDGSILTEADLDLSTDQVFYSVQEMRDSLERAVTLTDADVWDFQNKRATKAADAVDPTDVPTFGQLTDVNNNAQRLRDETEGFRNETETFKNNTQSIADQAQTDITNAGAAQVAAVNTEGTTQRNLLASEAAGFIQKGKDWATSPSPVDGEPSSKTSATEANLSAVTAQNGATVATNASVLAQEWASKPEDSPVQGSMFSSFHWSEKARRSAESITTGIVVKDPWDASTGNLPPTPVDPSVTELYIVQVAGVLPAPVGAVGVGDQIVWNSNTHVWYRIAVSAAVASVNGKTGAVVLNAADVHALSSVATTPDPQVMKTDLAIDRAGFPRMELTSDTQGTGGVFVRNSAVPDSGYRSIGIDTSQGAIVYSANEGNKKIYHEGNPPPAGTFTSVGNRHPNPKIGDQNFTLINKAPLNADDWSALSKGLNSGGTGNPYIYSLAASGDTFVAGFRDGYASISTDKGATWSALPRGLNSGSDDPYIYALAASGDTFVAGGLIGYAAISTDKGATWSALPKGLNMGVGGQTIYALAASGDTFVAGCGNSWAAISTDKGATWSALPYSLNSGGAGASTRSLAASGDTFVAGFGNGYAAISTDKGATWSALSRGLNSGGTDENIYALAASGDTFVAGCGRGYASISTDKGATWSALPRGLNSGNYYDIYALAASGDTFVACFKNGYASISTDKGATWSALPRGLNSGSTSNNIYALAASGGIFVAGFQYGYASRGAGSPIAVGSVFDGTDWIPIA